MTDRGVKVSVRLEWPDDGSKPFVIGRWDREGAVPYVRSWSLTNVAALGHDDLPVIVRAIIEQLEALLPQG